MLFTLGPQLVTLRFGAGGAGKAGGVLSNWGGAAPTWAMAREAAASAVAAAPPRARTVLRRGVRTGIAGPFLGSGGCCRKGGPAPPARGWPLTPPNRERAGQPASSART